MSSQAWNQFAIADRAGLHRTTVGQHLTGSRAIRDEHLLSYLQAVPTESASGLLAAWLHDLLAVHPDLLVQLLEQQSGQLTGSVRSWAPALTTRQQADLDYWAGNITSDKDLDLLLATLTRRARGE